MGGGGFLYEMNKAIERNKAMLKRKPITDKFERYGTSSGIGKDWKFKKASQLLLDNIKIKTAEDRKRSVYKRTFLLLIITAFFALGSWTLFNTKVEPPENPKVKTHLDLFTTKVYSIDKGMELRVDYIKSAGKVAETKYKNGMKHQNAESYYATGEQLRSAAYFYDTLVVEYHFFKNGDTIQNFPKITGDQVSHLAFRTKGNTKIVSFDYWDGKIIPGTYQEYDLCTGETEAE